MANLKYPPVELYISMVQVVVTDKKGSKCRGVITELTHPRYHERVRFTNPHCEEGEIADVPLP